MVGSKYITLVRQEVALRQQFPSAIVKRVADASLTWEHTLQPTAVSEEYRVRLVYTRTKGIEVFVLSPKLELSEGTRKLPHVYSTEQQKLCLYFPDGKEWNKSKYISQTIIPWISEWLYFYELWVPAGQWYGGGTTHDPKPEKDHNQ
jgi:hypothetical protein